MSTAPMFDLPDDDRLRAEGVQAAIDVLTDFAGAPGLYPTAGPDHPAHAQAAASRRTLDILIQRVTEVRDRLLNPDDWAATTGADR